MDLSPMRRGIVVDTGPLILYAFSSFQSGRYLPRVRSNIPQQDLSGVTHIIQNIFSLTRRVFVTAYVMAEFHAIARARGGLNGKGLTQLVADNMEMLTKLEEAQVDKDDVLGTKGVHSRFSEARELCFADTSIILSCQQKDASLLSMDERLIALCRKFDLPAFHLYYDCYLAF